MNFAGFPLGLGHFILRLLRLRPKYGIPCKTLRGEKVKSHGEKRVADYLYRNGILYEYEKTAKTWAFGKEIAKPDFYLPNYNVYVEYWGLANIDDKKTKARYRHSMSQKMEKYDRHGIKFISIYSNNLDDLDWIFRKRFREVTGKDLPKMRNNN